MAVDASTGLLHDEFGGLADLESGVLRTPLEPTISFSDDPLRMLRAARFAARFALIPADGLLQAAIDLSSRIEIVSAERVTAELERLLALPDPAPGLDFLTRAGIHSALFDDIEESAWEAGVARATAFSLTAPPGVNPLAGAGQRTWSPEEASAGRFACLLTGLEQQAATGLLNALRLSIQHRKIIQLLLRSVDLPVEPSPEALRRLVADVGFETVPLAVAVRAAVAEGSSPQQYEAVERLAKDLRDLGEREDLGDLEVGLTGQEVMALAGLAPGPAVGEAMRHLHEVRLVHGPQDRAGWERALHEWAD